MNYYRDQITTKSWELLQRLVKKYHFILIGGWAVWLYTKALKSKDIDLVVEFDQLEKLRQDFPLTKNERLKKYEIVQNEVQIDVYVPHYSQLGADIAATTQLKGFTVPSPETLIALKLVAHNHRSGSAKGRKDLIDIISLLTLPQLNWDQVPAEAAKLATAQTAMPELNLNPHQYSRLKKLCVDKLE